MRVTVPGKPLRQMMRWAQISLLTTAAGLLGYSVFVLADMWVFQRQASPEFDRLNLAPTSPLGPGVEAVGGLMGRMEIPRLGMTVIVAEGTAGATLRRAGGHIRGTGLPGHSGNIGIAGHRDTLFRPLRNVRQDDLIMLTTLQGEYRYRVVSTKIVKPTDVGVLSPDGQEILTLVTCYPFYFVGPSPDRFIVRAERVTTTHCPSAVSRPHLQLVRHPVLEATSSSLRLHCRQWKSCRPPSTASSAGYDDTACRRFPGA